MRGVEGMSLFGTREEGCTCYYCGLLHDLVEAGGIYYCPNPLCKGPGGAPHRAKLKSYELIRGDKHTVDATEWITSGKQWAAETNDAAIIAAAEKSAQYLLSRHDAAVEQSA